MNSSKADAPDAASWGVDQLQLLTALGFGPDSVLMSEPKLFVDLPFLAALQRELMNELGGEDTERTLFHIGAIHGLRDAARISSVAPHTVTVCSPLPMRFGRQKTRDGALELAPTGRLAGRNQPRAQPLLVQVPVQVAVRRHLR